MNPFIWILLACVAGLLIAHQVAMRVIAARAQRRMDADGPEALLDYLDSRWPNRLMPAYNLNYMRFAAYRRLGDATHADKTFSTLLAQSSAGRQRADLLVKGFEYYLARKDETQVRSLLERMAETANTQALAKELQAVADIVLDGSTAYIDQMKRQMEGADLPTRLRLLRLLALQYDSQGDAEAAKAAREEAARLSRVMA